MYQSGDRRLDALRMCADCRVIALTKAELEAGSRPRAPVRTTEDYLREREEERRARKPNG
jgi:hypothetical protein